MASEPRNTDLGSLLKRLIDAEVEFVLVGGLAAVAQGAPTTTFDADIVADLRPENIRKLVDVLNALGARQRRPDDKVIPPTTEQLEGKGHHLFVTDLGWLDVLGQIEGGLGYEELQPFTTPIEFRGGRLQVLKLTKILEMKRASKHPKDQRAVPLLEEALKQTGD